MIQFKEINGQLCKMLEKPVPLTEDAKFPCVVRLIQDDSPMGRYNKWNWEGLTELTHIRELIGLPDDTIPCVECDDDEHISHFEILGYPVADGSAEWALYQMMQGKKVHHIGISAERATMVDEPRYWYIENEVVRDSCNDIDTDTLEQWLKYVLPFGWQLYEPKKELCPACNGTGVVMHETPNDATQTDLPILDATQPKYEVGDWVEYMGEQRKIVGIPIGETKPDIKYWCAQDIGGNEIFIYADNITRKLSPSEVKVKVTLEGTVRSSINDCCFELSTPNGGWATIGFNEIDPATADLVRELIKKQEEK